MGQMRILGVDPGTRWVGWAVLERAEDGAVQRLESGSLRLGPPPRELALRLARMRSGLDAAIREWSPGVLALESGFFGNNAQSALRVGEARGVVLVCAAQHEIPVREIPPALVKRRIAGAGNASKAQIARLVALQLGIEADFRNHDESDALAIGLCAALEAHALERVAVRSGVAPGPPAAGGHHAAPGRLPDELRSRMREQ